MAYIVSTLQTAVQATGTTYVVNFPSGVLANDLLVVLLSQDGSTESLAFAASGFTAIGTQTESGACSSLPFFKIAAGGETSATFACANAAIIGTAILIRDAHATTPFGSVVDGTDFKRSDWNNVSSTASAALTTASDGTLLLYAWCSDGSNQFMVCELDEATGLDKFGAVGINHIIGYKQQQTAGAAPTVTMKHIAANEGGNGWVLAVRNKTGGALQPDIRATFDPVKYYGGFAVQDGTVTWQAADQFAASINSITCSSTAPTVANNATPSPQTPWGTDTTITFNTNTGDCWAGGTHTITSTDMSGKVFAVQWSRGQTPASGVQGADGVLIGFSDGTNWVAYQVANTSNGWSASEVNAGQVALGVATAYASSGVINWAAVTRIGYFMHRITTGTTAQSLAIKNAVLLGNTAMTGGGSSRPAKFTDYWKAMNSWVGWKYADLNGSAQVIAKSSIQVGDGTNSTYFDGAGFSLEFPQAWSATSVDNWQMRWNANDNAVTLNVKASASDTINLASGVAATDTLQNLTIDAASSSSSPHNLAQSFVGWNVTLNSSIPVSSATFAACSEIDGKGTDLTDVTVKQTISTDAAYSVTENGAVFDGVTLDVTGTSAAYHLELGTAVTAITLADVTFTGTPGTDKVHVLKTTGTVTITISGTTSLAAGDVTSAGATVVISAPVLYQSVTISNLTTGSRVQIYDTTSSTELSNSVAAGTTVTWTDSVAATASRAIRVRIAYVSGVTAKTFIEASIGTCGVTGGTEAVSYLANQTGDTTYNTNAVDGSAVTGITFTDAATDLVNANLAGGSTTWPRIYAAFVYWISTATGIADDISYVDGVDPANYLLTSTKVKNTSSPSVPLTITGGFARDATTGSIADIIDTTGGMIFPLVDHVVFKIETVGGVNVITGDIADIPAAPSAATVAAATLAAAATTPIAANIKQVNSLAVDGTGTESDPWGPV